jgi:hypothetical protein
MATLKQKKAVKKLVENGGNVSKAMRDAGFSPETAKTPKKLTESKGFKDLMDEMGLDDATLTTKHKELLQSQRMDHMTFPLGPVDEEDIPESEESDDEGEAHLPEEHKERTTLTDKEIADLLATVNCTVRRIVHGANARHVYFWSPDNKARKEALDMAYKIKGHYAPEKRQVSGALSLTALFDEAID